jgi:WD40 repeat protein/tRNA A-37 threonylcarbamoyl transferase component Bud32
MGTNLSERWRFIDDRCDQYEAEWRARRSPRMENFLEGSEGESRHALWCELMMLDQELRSTESHVPIPGEEMRPAAVQTAFLDVSTYQGASLGMPGSMGPDPVLRGGVGAGARRFGASPGDEGASFARDQPPAGSDPVDLPSTVGEIEGPHRPDDDLTVAPDMPSTVRVDLEELPDLETGVGAAIRRAVANPAPPGSKLGKYELIGKLAQGGMGVVYKARQVDLNRIVALKTIKAGALATDREIHLFQVEAEAVAKLDHPNIVPILEVGEQDGVRYYSMKLVEGQNLQECLARFQDRPRPLARLVAQVAEAIHHAHLRGVLHRDLKPANILIDADDQPHVVDWGLAKRLDVPADESTAGGAAGTPSFMSPEQARGQRESMTTVTDVYGLGTILYSLLAGRPPFQTGSNYETIRQVIERDPVPPRLVNPGVDPDLETICLKCLAKDPKERYASARELAEELERWLRGEPIQARPISRAERLVKWARRHPGMAGLILLVHLVGLAGLGGILLQANKTARANGLLKGALARANENEAEARNNEDAALHQAYIARMARAGQDWEHGNAGRVAQLLDQTRPQPGKRDYRDFEWYYLDRLGHRDRLTLSGHRDGVLCVDFSPDGKTLASGAGEGAIKVWDSTTGLLVRDLSGSRGQVYRVAYSPDGKKIVSGGEDKKSRLWDLATGQVIRTFEGHDSEVWWVAFSPDGKVLATASLDETVKLWDVASGGPRQTLPGHAQGAFLAKFSPDGKQLVAICGDRTLKLWDLETVRELRTFRGHRSPINTAAYRPDGKMLASAGVDSLIRLWDVSTGEPVDILPARHEVRALAYSPDGRTLVSAGSDQKATVWDLATRQPVRTFTGHSGTIVAVEISPDGRSLATASVDTTVKLWDTDLEQDARTLATFPDGLNDVVFGPDGTYVVAAGADKTVRFLDVPSGRLTRTLRRDVAVTDVRLSPDGSRLITSGLDGSLTVWSTATGEVIHPIKAHAGLLFGMAVSPDGNRLATSGKDRTLKLWDIGTGRILIDLRTGEIHALSFSPEGKYLASGEDDGSVLLRDPSSGREIRHLRDPVAKNIFAVAFSLDGKLVAASRKDHAITIWDVETGNRLAHNPLRGHTEQIMKLVFSPGGKRLASAGDDHTIRLWDPEIGEEVFTLRVNPGPVSGLAFSPDGKRLVSADNQGSLKLIDVSGSPVDSGDLKP